jgi:hypothetical protein
MQFHPASPDLKRAHVPYFDGMDTENAIYQFTCAMCNAGLAIPFSLVHRGAWGWREHFAEADVRTIEGFFSIERGRHVPPTPWPSVSSIECSSCRAKHIFYATYDEYKNSVFRITARGLAYSDA